jgi:HAD superfamily hydrolase (TIGR01509 family)
VTAALFLDVDGVLQFERPEFGGALEREYAWTDGYAAFEQQLLHDSMEARSLVGQGDLLAVVERILPRHVQGLSAEDFFARWLAESIQLNDELVARLATVTVPVLLVTNQDRLRGARVRELYAGRPWLTDIVMSCEIGYAKPEPEFFQITLARAGQPAAECLFVDDKPYYLAGAAAVGLPGLQYRGNDQLIPELVARGLLG